MKRITTLIVSMLLIASSVWARTPEEAAAIASGFMSQKGTDASVVQRVQRAKSTGVAQSTVSLEYIQNTAYFGEEVELNEFTIRVKKGALCDMVTSDGLYLWWWSDVDGNEFVSTTLQDGWYTATISSAASTINCLAANQNSWGGQQQTIDYTDITGDICLEIGAPDEYSYYDIYETSCEEEFIPASSYHDFSNETNNAQWHFAQDGQANYWTIGWGADVINPTLYITMDGDTYDYLEGTSSTSWAYIPVTLTETDQISFNWQGAGELNYDYLSVYLCPADWHPTSGSTTIPSDAIRLAHNLCEASQWQEEVCTPNVSGAYYLCFMWRNDASVGNGTPIMIDNVRYGTPEVSTVPTAEDLAEYEQDGYFVACINFQGEVCNDIVFVGSYNGWSTTPEEMVHFTPLGGFDGWYVAVVPVVYDEYGAEANEGKPVQLRNNGEFSWEYQTGDASSWELIAGSVDIYAGYSGESNLQYWSSAEPVILKSAGWKYDQSPCDEAPEQEYTIYLNAPDCGGFEPAIIGDFNGWAEGVAMELQPDGSYKAVITSFAGQSFKFKATTDIDWSNEIQILSDGVWVNNPNITLGEQTNIYIDYSDGRYSSCEDVDEPSAQVKGDRIWPIILDDITASSNASKIVADFRSNDSDNFLYIWASGETYVSNTITDLNFQGNDEGYLSLTVAAPDGWSGLGFTLGDASAAAAEQLRQRIIANPDNYYLHFAMKATTQGNHQFYTFNTNATSFAVGAATIDAGQVIGDFPRDGEWYEFDVPMADFADALATSTFPMGGNIFCALSGATVGSQLNLDALYFYEIEGEEEEEETEYSYTIRVKKDDVSDMDLSNGLYLWWWYNDQAGQLANMTLGDDGWYTTTITTTANSINCLAVNTDVVNNDWTGQQTIDYTNITGDVCLAIGAKDWIYNYNYNLYEIPCSPMEYTTEHDFEDTEANAQWRFVQNGQTNYWTIGSAAGSMDSGSNALYITSDGNNYTYNNNASSTSWAYIPVTVTAIDSITFYWKGEGESNYDDLQVYLFPKGCTPIAGSTYIPNSAIQLGEYLSGQTDWQYFSAMAGVEGEYNLCLRWYNDGSIGEMPIAVDNMAITTPLNTTEYPLTYVLNEDGTATVVKCATDHSGNVSIPTVVTYNGTTYTVTSISENAFKECGYLTSVTIPNSVTSIGRMAFAYCRSLESVTLSENISSVEDYTFYHCESLTSITIPNNVTYVGNCAFEYCYNLSAVTFGDNVTTIDNYAFAGCSSLSSVTIPASVSYIGYSTFASCNSLNSIVVESGNTAYDSRNNCNAIIETASNTLIAGCQSTIIPETVTTIGEQAFYNCDGLTTIVIPNSVTSIGYSAFAYCDNLSSVDLGNGVTTINGSAFEYCYAMTSVTIPASVTEIGSWAFYYCPTIVMEGTTPPTISSSTFKSEATIFVPCTALDTYLATSVWQDLNLQGSNYTVTLSATEGGYAQITASDCATNTVTIEAYPEERYVFTQWSDGNTDNPRILTLTEDIVLTAEFTILTYPVTNLVVTTNCGKAYASWEGDAPYYELTMYSIDGTVVLYDLVPNHYKDGVSNSNPYEEGDYYCQVRPMYSNSEGDYAGEAVQAPFTISADNCVDIEIHDLSYTITDETTVNLTWNSEAYVYHVQLYDYQNNLIADEYINTNSYSYTLPEMGRYSFYVLGYNEDQTQFSSWQNISFDIVYSNWEYDLNFVYGEQGDNGPWNDAYQRPIHLYSGDYQTVMRIYPMPKYENSIIGTYFVENNTDNLYAGGMWGDGSYITYNGISTGAIQCGMVTIARNEENKFVVSFDLTDANGINYTNTCTIENMSGSNITDDNVTALSASQALTLTQNLPDHDLTTMPYMVNGVISRITSYDVNLYSRARFYISEDGSTTNEFYCYNTSWLNNTSFTTGDEIAEGDTVVIYGNLQNYQGTTPEIKGYVYQHFAKEVDESCYTLTVDATEGGYVSISPLAECYKAGTQVVITATPNENYEFVTWSDGNTSAQRTIVMDKDYNLTATFRSTSIPTNNYTLTLTCDEGGTVGKNPNYEYYEENSTVTIFANANEGYKFVQWSDDNTENPRIITITQDIVLHATFIEEEKQQYSLNINASEGGTVTKDPDQEQYEEGTQVTITAIANDGFEFVTWSDGVTDAQRVIVMNRNYNLTATFKAQDAPGQDDCYTLVLYPTINAGQGGYAYPSPSYDCYEPGTSVVIHAHAFSGFEFSHWQDGNTESDRTIVMNQDCEYTAYFVPTTNYYVLNVTATDGGSVMKNPNQEQYEEGTQVTITAIPNDGFEFVTWNDGVTNAQRTIIMDKNYNLTATFKQTISEYDITGLVVTSSNLRITAKWKSTATRFDVTITNSQNEVVHNEKVDLTEENKVYRYTASKYSTYTVNVKPIDNDNKQIGKEAEKSVTLVKKYNLYIYTEYGGTVNEEVNGDYLEGETVEIIATPNKGYRFNMWDDGDTNEKRTLVMNQDYYLMAMFTRIPTYVLTIYEGENGKASMETGTYEYQENEVVTITPIPNEGYVFDHWMVNSIEDATEEITLTMIQDYSIYPVCIPIETGVENLYSDITIRVKENTIIVEATQKQDFVLYDLVGHLIETQTHTNEATFTAPGDGLYLLRTNNGIKKVRVE